MCFFKKKGGPKQIMANKDQLMNNAKYAESLANYAGIDSKVANTITELADKLKYLNPSERAEVATLDRKIENKLSDIKIEITSSKINEAKFENLIKDLTNLIADRDFESRKK